MKPVTADSIPPGSTDFEKQNAGTFEADLQGEAKALNKAGFEMNKVVSCRNASDAGRNLQQKGSLREDEFLDSIWMIPNHHIQVILNFQLAKKRKVLFNHNK